MRRDLAFISGEFAEVDIPNDKRFLLKYFTTEAQQAFLKYYLVFGDWRCFTAHTGFVSSAAYLREQTNRYLALVEAYTKAKSEISAESLETLSKIQSGEWKV